MNSSSLDGRVFFYTNKHDIDHAVKRISDIAKIKLTRAKERFATALDFSSYNHLIAHFKEYRYVGAHAPVFIEKLITELDNIHQILLNPTQYNELVALSDTPEKLFSLTTFNEFYRFSLFNTEQHIPLHELDHINYTYQDNYEQDEQEDYCEQLNKTLFSFLTTGKTSPILLNTIDTELKYTRALANNESDWAFEGNGQRYTKLDQLNAFKKALIEFGTPFPLFTYNTLFAICTTNGIHTPTQNIAPILDVLQQRPSNPIYIGKTLTPLDSYFVEDYYETDYSTDYTHPFYKLDDSTPPALSEVDIIVKAKSVFGFYDADELRATSCLFHSHINPFITLSQKEYSNIEWRLNTNDDNLLQSLREQGDTVIQFLICPIVKIGTPLTAAEKKAINKSFNMISPTYTTFENDRNLIIPSSVERAHHTNPSHTDNHLLKLVGETFATILTTLENATITFSDALKAIYTTITSTDIKNPYGFDGIGMVSRFYETNEYLNIDDEYNISKELKTIANAINKHPDLNIDIQDTYIDNLEKYKHLYKTDDGQLDYLTIDEHNNGEFICLFDLDELNTLHYFTHEEGINSTLPFHQCNNVYIVSFDTGYAEIKHFIAGYDKNGQQIINGVYYPFIPNEFHQTDWLVKNNWLRKISDTITGKLHYYDLELSIDKAFCFDDITEGLHNHPEEIDFVEMYFQNLQFNEFNVVLTITNNQRQPITNPELGANAIKHSISQMIADGNTQHQLDYFHHITPQPDGTFKATTSGIYDSQNLPGTKHQTAIQLDGKDYTVLVEFISEK